MTLVSVKDMLSKAYKEQYAIGHFDVHNIEWAQATLSAAQELNSPVIIGVTEDAVKYFGGYFVVQSAVSALIKEMNITVPVALHLDHGSSVENCITAIDAGFTSVMFDGSHYSLEKNIELTNAVIAYGKPRNITVEAEIGSIDGEEGSIVSSGPVYAKLEDCIELAQACEIDSLAPSLGSVHGKYKGEPKLDFDKMKAINEALQLPLVLHGASGLYPEQIKEAISLGTAKINVNADNHIAFTNAVRQRLSEDDKIYSAFDYIPMGTEAVKQMIMKKIKLFGSDGKA